MYSTREIFEFSPSRLDGINVQVENWYRWSYCEFLKDAGMKINVYLFFLFSCQIFTFCYVFSPQLTIATAVVFCHKFFAHHSHKQPENERYVFPL